jgi:hypothetical protein
MESAESDAENGASSQEESRRQKAADRMERSGLTAGSWALFHLYILSTFTFLTLCLLLAAIGILVGLISLQPFPFLHSISRLA